VNDLFVENEEETAKNLLKILESERELIDSILKHAKMDRDDVIKYLQSLWNLLQTKKA